MKSYLLLWRATPGIGAHKDSIDLRREVLDQMKTPTIKVAFDTRKLDEDYVNPRRGLQNYNRSEEYISQATKIKLGNFKRLQEILEGIKDKYSESPNWKDSYARVLLNAVNSTLRDNINDEEYSETQKSISGVNYLEELLYVRYRLSVENLKTFSDEEIRDLILAKDPELLKSHNYEDNKKEEDKDNIFISKATVQNSSYGDLLDKLFDIRANKENPEVERVITITITDKVK